MHPGPIQTTRHVTDASRVTRLGGRARRTGTVASRQENFAPSRNADVSLTPLFAPVVGRRRRCHHRPHGVPRVRRHHQARRRQRRARFLRKCPSRRSPSRRARVRPRTVDPASASNLDANSNSWGLSAVTRQLPDGARHLARVGFGQMFFARRCFSPRAENPKTTTHRRLTALASSSRMTAQQDHRRQG